MPKPYKEDKRNPKKKDKMKSGRKNKTGKVYEEETTALPLTTSSVSPTKQSTSVFNLSSTVSTPTAGLSSTSTGKINSGTIAAIVISSLAFVLLVVILIKLFMKKQQRTQTKSSTYQMYSEVDHSTALGDSIRVNPTVNPHGNINVTSPTGLTGNTNPEHFEQDNVYYELDPTGMAPIHITQPTYDQMISSVNIPTSQNPNGSLRVTEGSNPVEISVRERSQNEHQRKPNTNSNELTNETHDKDQQKHQLQQHQTEKMPSGQQQKTNTLGNFEISPKPDPQQSEADLTQTDVSNEYLMLEPNEDFKKNDQPDNAEYFVLEPESAKIIKE